MQRSSLVFSAAFGLLVIFLWGVFFYNYRSFPERTPDAVRTGIFDWFFRESPSPLPPPPTIEFKCDSRRVRNWERWPSCPKPGEAYHFDVVIIEGRHFRPGNFISRVEILRDGTYVNAATIRAYPERTSIAPGESVTQVGADGTFTLLAHIPKGGVHGQDASKPLDGTYMLRVRSYNPQRVRDTAEYYQTAEREIFIHNRTQPSPSAGDGSSFSFTCYTDATLTVKDPSCLTGGYFAFSSSRLPLARKGWSAVRLIFRAHDRLSCPLGYVPAGHCDVVKILRVNPVRLSLPDQQKYYYYYSQMALIGDDLVLDGRHALDVPPGAYTLLVRGPNPHGTGSWDVEGPVITVSKLPAPSPTPPPAPKRYSLRFETDPIVATKPHDFEGEQNGKPHIYKFPVPFTQKVYGIPNLSHQIDIMLDGKPLDVNPNRPAGRYGVSFPPYYELYRYGTEDTTSIVLKLQLPPDVTPGQHTVTLKNRTAGNLFSYEGSFTVNVLEPPPAVAMIAEDTLWVGRDAVFTLRNFTYPHVRFDGLDQNPETFLKWVSIGGYRIHNPRRLERRANGDVLLTLPIPYDANQALSSSDKGAVKVLMHYRVKYVENGKTWYSTEYIEARSAAKKDPVLVKAGCQIASSTARITLSQDPDGKGHAKQVNQNTPYYGHGAVREFPLKVLGEGFRCGSPLTFTLKGVRNGVPFSIILNSLATSGQAPFSVYPELKADYKGNSEHFLHPASHFIAHYAEVEVFTLEVKDSTSQTMTMDIPMRPQYEVKLAKSEFDPGEYTQLFWKGFTYGRKVRITLDTIVLTSPFLEGGSISLFEGTPHDFLDIRIPVDVKPGTYRLYMEDVSGVIRGKSRQGAGKTVRVRGEMRDEKKDEKKEEDLNDHNDGFPLIWVNPTSGPAGITVTIKGLNWKPGENSVFLRDQAGNETKLPIFINGCPHARSCEPGELLLTVKIPASLSAGRYALTVMRGTQKAEQTFTLVQPQIPTPSANAQIILTPSTGPRHTFVTITGAGFTPRAGILVKFDSDKLSITRGGAATDERGVLAGTVVLIPGAAEGSHTITVKDGQGHEARATFTIATEPKRNEYSTTPTPIRSREPFISSPLPSLAKSPSPLPPAVVSKAPVYCEEYIPDYQEQDCIKRPEPSVSTAPSNAPPCDPDSLIPLYQQRAQGCRDAMAPSSLIRFAMRRTAAAISEFARQIGSALALFSSYLIP